MKKGYLKQENFMFPGRFSVWKNAALLASNLSEADAGELVEKLVAPVKQKLNELLLDVETQTGIIDSTIGFEQHQKDQAATKRYLLLAEIEKIKEEFGDL